jgi:hypothetical protein
MQGTIWGVKTIAAFDAWSIEHFITGISIGAIVAAQVSQEATELPKKFFYRYHLYKILFIAFLWESIEHYLEEGLAGPQVEYWFQGVEFWANRLITDPLLVALGYFLILKYRKIALPGRVFSVIWLGLHIFVFPHSMYLHYIV